MTILAVITIGIDPVAFRLWSSGSALVWSRLRLGHCRCHLGDHALCTVSGSDQGPDGAIFSWGIPAGLLGGRLLFTFVQNDFGTFLHHPLTILAIWQGGMAFYGAIFAVAALIYSPHLGRGYPLWPFLDAGALLGVLGQAFGRLGNIVNGDIVGYPTKPPGERFTPTLRVWRHNLALRISPRQPMDCCLISASSPCCTNCEISFSRVGLVRSGYQRAVAVFFRGPTASSRSG